MRQSHKVAAQFLRPAQQRVGILSRVAASTAIGLLLMDADALQEDGLSIQQDLFALCLDGAEANLVIDGLATKRNLHLI